MKVDQFPDRIIHINNEDYLYFGGTAYLGLPTNPEFQQLLFNNIVRWGTAYGSSRSANVKLSAYENGEKFLARYINAESALTVSSGMLAGKLVLEVLKRETDYFFHFPNTHNAIKIAGSFPFFIDKKLNPRLLDSVIEKITILTDSVPSLKTQPIDLSILNKISKNKEITLLIDESHSLGILGKQGRGIYCSIELPNIKRKIMIASLGKAMGLSGGAIASDLEFINQIKSIDTFVSSAGMNPAFVQTLVDAEPIYIAQNKKLRDSLTYIKANLITNKKILFDADYPLIYPKIAAINSILLANKIIVTNFQYPTGNKELNRIVITANHRKEDLDVLIRILNKS
ncbi:MAG: pyridoxal phosphate-dependent aminotransferase family protein [Flavobacterium micromati]|nr:pyridoxal phosphate-dependent aminotransferase family protein [Flavobacterium micromati]